MTPDDLFAQLADPNRRGLPPVHTWHPEREGDSHMRIDAQGRWFHEGTEIRRQPMVRLFASILRREGDDYYLVTPVEKLSIRVEDVPFLVVDMDVRGTGERQEIAFATNTGDVVVLDAAHPIRVAVDREVRPYVAVRDGLEALINRAVYYRLADLTVTRDAALGVWSSGTFFRLDPPGG